MDDLLVHGLQDIYYAENQILKALPKMIDKATNRDLSKELRDHFEETEKQVGRLDQIFKKLGQSPQGTKCPAIDGLISEADEVAGEVADKGCAGRGHRWRSPIRGALRDRALWHFDRVGRKSRSRRHHQAAQY
jgi:ferritin-like metal-binding protein YciE